MSKVATIKQPPQPNEAQIKYMEIELEGNETLLLDRFNNISDIIDELSGWEE